RGSCAIPLEARLLSWLFLFLGVYQFRYMSFFFVFSAIPLALHIDRLLPERLDIRQIQRSLSAAGIIGAFALPLAFMQTEAALGLPQMLSEQDALYPFFACAHSQPLERGRHFDFPHPRHGPGVRGRPRGYRL